MERFVARKFTILKTTMSEFRSLIASVGSGYMLSFAYNLEDAGELKVSEVGLLKANQYTVDDYPDIVYINPERYSSIIQFNFRFGNSVRPYDFMYGVKCKSVDESFEFGISNGIAYGDIEYFRSSPLPHPHLIYFFKATDTEAHFYIYYLHYTFFEQYSGHYSSLLGFGMFKLLGKPTGGAIDNKQDAVPNVWYCGDTTLGFPTCVQPTPDNYRIYKVTFTSRAIKSIMCKDNEEKDVVFYYGCFRPAIFVSKEYRELANNGVKTYMAKSLRNGVYWGYVETVIYDTYIENYVIESYYHPAIVVGTQFGDVYINPSETNVLILDCQWNKVAEDNVVYDDILYSDDVIDIENYPEPYYTLSGLVYSSYYRRYVEDFAADLYTASLNLRSTAFVTKTGLVMSKSVMSALIRYIPFIYVPYDVYYLFYRENLRYGAGWWLYEFLGNRISVPIHGVEDNKAKRYLFPADVLLFYRHIGPEWYLMGISVDDLWAYPNDKRFNLFHFTGIIYSRAFESGYLTPPTFDYPAYDRIQHGVVYHSYLDNNPIFDFSVELWESLKDITIQSFASL